MEIKLSISKKPEANLSFLKNRADKDLLKTAALLSGHGVLCGSFVLAIYNLLNRPIKDLDLLVDKNNPYVQTLLEQAYDRREKYKYNNEISVDADQVDQSDLKLSKGIPILGTVDINGYEVDLLEGNTTDFREVLGFKTQPLKDVINHKIKLITTNPRIKDIQDLIYIEKQLN